MTAPGATPRPMLDVCDLDVYIGESHILHGVSFTVPRDGITAMLGRNGAGKTTTLRGLLGLVPRNGRVLLDGDDVTSASTSDIVRRGVGYVPEGRDVFAGLTVAENLRIAERPGARHRYALVYELFPRLRERSGQRAGTLSGGEQQMLALARAMLNDDSALLLVDEPSQGLAPNLVRDVADALQRMTELATTLVVEQNLGVIRRIADHVVVLDQGVVVHDGPAAELFADPRRTEELLGVSHQERAGTRPGGEGSA